jgi:hypothetical protein
MAKKVITLRSDIDYRVRFKINHKINYGESIIVLGSIPHLDKWKKQGPFTHILKHLGNNNWESAEPLITRSGFFHYKYAVVKDNHV